MAPRVPEEPSEQYLEHRQRLLDGMAEAVRRDGLSGSTVADVVMLAGVSRRTFYEHFSDLVDCYLTLMEALGEAMLEGARWTVGGEGTVPERIERAVAGYLAMLEEDPALARSYWTEYHLTGERGLGQVAEASERTARLLHELAADLRAAAGVDRPLPFDAAVMLAGALRETVLLQFLRGRPTSASQTTLTWLFRLVVLADDDAVPPTDDPATRSSLGRPDRPARRSS